jgi:hypothetical protein
MCSTGHELYLKQKYSPHQKHEDSVALARTASIKSTKEKQKNQENKKKNKRNKVNNKNNKDDSLATLEAMTKTEEIPKYAWLD